MKPLKLTTIESYPGVPSIKLWLSTRSRDDNCVWVQPIVHELYSKVTPNKELDAILTRFDRHPQHRIGVQDGRLLALEVHRLARQENNLASQYVYRAIGHAIATIHVHTHTYGTIVYGVKALHQMGYSEEQIHEFIQKYNEKG